MVILMPRCVRRRDQPLESGHPAEQRVDVSGIGDVVAVVGHRRDGDRVEPNRVDSKLFQVIQTVGQPVEVADAVTVTVGERARIHLVENRDSTTTACGAHLLRVGRAVIRTRS